MAKASAKSPDAPAEDDPLVAQAFAPDSQASRDALADAIGRLSRDEAQIFLARLEFALRKRRIMISGYIVAMIAWLVAMVCALAYFGMANGFVGWVFLVPFAIVGVILWAFGAWANKVGRRAPPHPGAANTTPAK